MKPSYTKDRDALLTRLNRIEGQVRGVNRMVDQEVYCIDVLTQIYAARIVFKSWSRRPDSNRRPAVYKSEGN